MKEIIPKTEFLYQKSDFIDQLNLEDAIDLIIAEQKESALEVLKSAKSIKKAITKITEYLCLYQESRIIYAGAGTSGRIGLQDGVELFPTFNWPRDRLDYIIAGGNQAILSAIENAEDDVVSAKEIIRKKVINNTDIIIGIAASGNTPFTCKVLEEAFKKDALTIAISNNPDGKILKFGKINIVLDTKEEVIAGSTRLKAGTAQKICLNTISTMVMVNMGKVKNGMMSNMVPTNEKLRKRKINIEKKLTNN